FSREPIDYWPITNSAFWFQWHSWGPRPTGYHAVNLALHIVDALLLWAILSRLAIPGSFLAALLFAVHPVNVESVAWIAQLKNVLSLFFFFLSLLWYLQFDARPATPSQSEQKTENQPPPQRWLWYWLSFSAFVLAMLSKGSVAVLPLLLLLITW